MPINIRAKGQDGERDIANKLNEYVDTFCHTRGFKFPVKPLVQRNQNQSAVGGSDLTNPFKLCIEIKRQEQLSINTWWNQCLVASEEFGGIPILIFRQNKQKWRVIMWLYSPQTNQYIRSEITWEAFCDWFYTYITLEYDKGNWELP